MKTKTKRKPKILVDEWLGCYPSDWKDKIVQRATEHPAKYSSRLIERIYQHLVEMKWVERGDSVVDPFAGVGLGALHALQMGLNWTGNELENRWYELAFESYPCPGFSKDFWIRFNNRPEVIKGLRDARQLCPDCESRLMSDVKLKNKKVVMRTIPQADPHTFMGNIPTWNKKFSQMPKWGNAQMFNGDSRFLSQIFNTGQTVAMKSPPFGQANSGGGIVNSGYAARDGSKDAVGNRSYRAEVHGMTEGNLANLKLSEDGFELSLSSPHKADSINSATNGIDWTKVVKDYPTRKMRDERIAYNDSRHSSYNYGSRAGQLGAMKGTEEGFDASIASPPFRQTSGGTAAVGGVIDDALMKRQAAGNANADGYGGGEGQLANMSEGDLDSVLSSPVNGEYEAAMKSPPHTNANLPQADRDYSKLVDQLEKNNGRKMKRSKDLFGAGGYGDHPSNLGTMPTGDIDSQIEQEGHTVAISSPPYEKSLSKETVDSSSRRRLARARGESNAENVSPIEGEKAGLRTQEYGITAGNMGNEQGDNFWGAARQIVEEVYANLKPGGHAVWVCKNFVRNWEVVDFCDQWRRLCEAVGFVTLHEHRAMLSRNKGTSFMLDVGADGEHLSHTEVKTSKGFFRRLRESKGTPPIDWEIVYCMVKPE